MLQELRFRVPSSAWGQVRRECAAHALDVRTARLVQFDTSEGALAHAGLRPDGQATSMALDGVPSRAQGRRRRAVWLRLRSLGGRSDVLLQEALDLVDRHGVWLEPEQEPGRLPEAPQVPDKRVDAAWQHVLGELLQQALGHAGKLSVAPVPGAGDEDRARSVHQLRVVLRRMRSLSRLFRSLGVGLSPSDEDALAKVFRSLGGRRDHDVIVETLAPVWIDAACPALTWPGPRDQADPLVLLRTPSTTRLWLSLWGEVHRPSRLSEGNVRARLTRVLRKQARQLRRDLQAIDALDIEARHRLRRRVKRHRYAVEACRRFWRPQRVDAYLRELAAVQDALGCALDLFIVLQRLEARVRVDRLRVALARGWLLARIGPANAAASQAAQALLRTRRPWS